MAEISVLGVAWDFILAIIFNIFNVLVAVDLRFVDIVILALWSCISMLGRVPCPRSLDIVVLLLPSLQLPDKARIGVDLRNILSYLVAVLEHMLVCLIVSHPLVFD